MSKITIKEINYKRIKENKWKFNIKVEIDFEDEDFAKVDGSKIPLAPAFIPRYSIEVAPIKAGGYTTQVFFKNDQEIIPFSVENEEGIHQIETSFEIDSKTLDINQLGKENLLVSFKLIPRIPEMYISKEIVEEFSLEGEK